MITEKDLQEAIAECEGQRNPNANTCIKLAALYTIREHLYPSTVTPSYSFAPSEPVSSDAIIQYNSGTEFSDLIHGRSVDDILPVIDDLISTISVVNPKLYRSVIRELSYQ